MSAWTAAKSLRQTAGGERLWWVIDARGWRVGRLASYVSQLLQGKHKPTYHSALDCGDHVVVLHSEALQFSGNKWDEKMYRWHTGYMGGLKGKFIISVFLCLRLSLSLCVSLSLSLFSSLCLCVSFSFFLSLSLCFSLLVCVSLFVSLSLSVSLSLCLSLFSRSFFFLFFRGPC